MGPEKSGISAKSHAYTERNRSFPELQRYETDIFSENSGHTDDRADMQGMCDGRSV
jgi:hypothetical protein